MSEEELQEVIGRIPRKTDAQIAEEIRGWYKCHECCDTGWVHRVEKRPVRKFKGEWDGTGFKLDGKSVKYDSTNHELFDTVFEEHSYAVKCRHRMYTFAADWKPGGQSK